MSFVEFEAAELRVVDIEPIGHSVSLSDLRLAISVARYAHKPLRYIFLYNFKFRPLHETLSFLWF